MARFDVEQTPPPQLFVESHAPEASSPHLFFAGIHITSHINIQFCGLKG
jgi:hypothetical protein